MKAAVVRHWDGPEALMIEDAPDPAPQAGDVVVHLRASSLNWHDVIARQGVRDLPCPASWAWLAPGFARTPARR